MILRKLFDFATEQMELPPPNYREIAVRWLIDLKQDGTLIGFVPWGGDGKAKKGTTIVAPYMKRAGVKPNPQLLVDNGEYILGIVRAKSDPTRAKKCHESFKQLIKLCYEKTQEVQLKGIIQFLDNWEPEQNLDTMPSGFMPEDNITFRVDGLLLADRKLNLQKIEQFWASHTSGEDEDRLTLPMMQCLITGETAAVTRRMPESIRGLRGGQPSGTEIVSANQKPFTSYGLENSLTSPISRNAAEKFAKALNHLLSDERSHIAVGLTSFIFWTRQKNEDVPIWMLEKPDPQAVKNLLESPDSGSQVYKLNDDAFYALSLTASKSRAVVRDWLETTIPAARDNLKKWFINQKMVDGYGVEVRSFSVYTLAASVYRDPSKEMQPTVPTALIRHALSGTRLPDDLLVKLVRRNRAEQDITYPRAVLIKLVLISQGKLNMTDMDALNLNSQLGDINDAAYHCGRLLAELEEIQRTAQGNTNATLVDRYYGSASSTPAKAFAPLMRGVQNHLSKLRKNSPGLYKLCDQRLEEIMLNFPEKRFPNTLTMSHQAIFSLGYYHQRANNRAVRAAIAKAKAEKANKAEKVIL